MTLENKECRLPNQTGGIQNRFPNPTSIVANVFPVQYVTMRRLYEHFEEWPIGQRVKVKVRPGEFLAVELDIVRALRPDLRIEIQCPHHATWLLWQRAVNYGTHHALHGRQDV